MADENKDTVLGVTENLELDHVRPSGMRGGVAERKLEMVHADPLQHGAVGA